jgi:hypothetical protein
MRRAGVIVLSLDSAAKAFVDDVLDDVAPAEGESIGVSCARTCLAVLGLPVRRRMLVIDGAPPDLTVNALLEAVRVVDSELPVLLIRYEFAGPPRTHGRVLIVPGPLVSCAGATALERLLAMGGDA